MVRRRRHSLKRILRRVHARRLRRKHPNISFKGLRAFNRGLLRRRALRRYRKRLRRKFAPGFLSRSAKHQTARLVVRDFHPLYNGFRVGVGHKRVGDIPAYVEPKPQSDSDFATFCISPFRYDPWGLLNTNDEVSELNTVGSFPKLESIESVNEGPKGTLNVLPAFVAPQMIGNLDSRVKTLARAYRLFKINKISCTFNMPRLVDAGNGGDPSYSDNLVLYVRHTDDLQQDPLYDITMQYMKPSIGSNTNAAWNKWVSINNPQVYQDIMAYLQTAPGLCNIARESEEGNRKVLGNKWRQYPLRPGKSVTVRWVPKTFTKGNQYYDLEFFNQSMPQTNTPDGFSAVPSVPTSDNDWKQHQLGVALQQVAQGHFAKSRWLDTRYLVNDTETPRIFQTLMSGPVFLLIDKSRPVVWWYDATGLPFTDNYIYSLFPISLNTYYDVSFKEIRNMSYYSEINPLVNEDVQMEIEPDPKVDVQQTYPMIDDPGL